MATTLAPERVSPRPAAAGSLGRWVIPWIESNCVHGEGDYAGQPFKLAPFQRRIVNRCYEIDAEGRRLWDRVVLGLPKGNGKTPLAGAIAQAELDGPVVFDGWDADGKPKAKQRTSPTIPVAAASFEQADLLFGDCYYSAKNGPLKSRLEAFETEILPRDITGRDGSIYKVAAVAGTNDGRRPTFFVADEVHEWEGKKERVHLVLSNGRAKRADAWELSISTAGWDGESLLAKLYRRGKADTDPRLLLIWHEADPALDLSDPVQRALAIRQANPAVGLWLSFDAIEARYHEIDEHEFRRYYLNQWTSVPEQWIKPEMWDAAARPDRVVAPGAPVALGFDGSHNRDSTALIGCTLDEPRHLFTLGIWARPENVKEWKVPKEEVRATILKACLTYRVQAMGADDSFAQSWADDFDTLAEKGVPVVSWPTRSNTRMAPACGRFWGDLNAGHITHDGSPVLRAHAMNCHLKMTAAGPVIVKAGGKNSKTFIDAAVAAVVGSDVAQRNEGGSVYDSNDVKYL